MGFDQYSWPKRPGNFSRFVGRIPSPFCLGPPVERLESILVGEPCLKKSTCAQGSHLLPDLLLNPPTGPFRGRVFRGVPKGGDRRAAWGAVELVHRELVVAREGHDLRPAVARHLEQKSKAQTGRSLGTQKTDLDPCQVGWSKKVVDKETQMIWIRAKWLGRQ